MIKAIETEFDGYRFRSRTEARWAVFFKTAGIKFQYEPEGFELSDGTRYLPDFWLTDAKMWFEVKGQDPTAAEINSCKLLAKDSGFDALLAVGPPGDREENIQLFRSRVSEESDDPFDAAKMQFMADRRNEGEFWLANFSTYCCGTKIIFVSGSPNYDRYPVIEPLLRTYNAAKSARFEHGESGAPR